MQGLQTRNVDEIFKDMTAKRIFDIERNMRHETTKWLFGLDYPAKWVVRAFFMPGSYTDKISRTKVLGQPHLILNGPTGRGKTDLVQCVAFTVDAIHNRISGNPEIMPYHFLGQPHLVEEDGRRIVRLDPKTGKIFAHVLLIDESSRITEKAKAALLEGMEERSVTANMVYDLKKGEERPEMPAIPLFPLSGDPTDVDGPRFFIVMMTQNPQEIEAGTYENVYGELDRLTLSIDMERPSFEEESKISSKRVVGKRINKVTDLYEILAASRFIYENVTMPRRTEYYRTSLIRNTDPKVVEGSRSFVNCIKENVEVVNSPRANLHLEVPAYAEAFFDGSNLMRPEHIKGVAELVMAHRIGLKSGRERYITRKEVLNEVIKNTRIPPW